MNILYSINRETITHELSKSPVPVPKEIWKRFSELSRAAIEEFYWDSFQAA